jgi:DNA (cytosine-5)-methyltransferase 1
MFRALSLFSGCGGLDKGFEDLGFDVVAAIDNNQYAVETYNRNMSGPAICLDVQSDLFQGFLKDVGQIDLLIGGFPCQGFSKSGPKRINDPRNDLFHAMVTAASLTRPSVIIAENVDGMKQNYGGSAIATVKSEFAKLGYKGSVRIVDFASYGLAQHRRRAIFVFTQHGDPSNIYPESSHHSEARNGEFKINATLPLFEVSHLAPCRKMSDVLMDFAAIEDPSAEHVFFKDYPLSYEHIIKRIGQGQKLCDVRKASTSVHSWEIPEFFGEVSTKEKDVLEALSVHRRHKKYGDVPNGNPMTPRDLLPLTGMCLEDIEIVFQSLVKKKYLKRKFWGWDLANATFNSGIFKRPLWDSPSPTVLTNFYSPRYFLHPFYDRPFTVREAARLQSFPDSFSFMGLRTDGAAIKEAFRQIGNAVPPLFSMSLAKQVLLHLREYHVDSTRITPEHTFASIAA